MNPPLRIPLHRPPAPLAPSERARYEKSLLVAGIGEAGQERIRAARVLVVGAGGLGSPVLLYLAAAGVGVLGVADPDPVDSSNLQRQILHDEGTAGVVKSRSAASRLARLNSSVEVECFGRVTAEWLEAHGAEWDLLVECTDSFDSKYLIADWCARSGVPLVWGTVVGTDYQVAVFWSAAPDPWPRASLRSLHPEPPASGRSPCAATAGVLGPVAGEAGAVMAGEALKLIAGFGEPLLGRVLVCGAARRRTSVLDFAGPGVSEQPVKHPEAVPAPKGGSPSDEGSAPDAGPSPDESSAPNGGGGKDAS